MKTETAEFLWFKLKAAITSNRPLLGSWCDAVKRAQIMTHFSPYVMVLTFKKSDKHAMEGLMRQGVRQYIQTKAEELTGEPILIVGTIKTTKKQL